MMTVGELIALLEEMDEDAEVRLAFQPRWPFEYSIGAVVESEDGDDEEEGDEERDEADDEDSATRIVYIGEGEQLGYLSGAAAKELGWK